MVAGILVTLALFATSMASCPVYECDELPQNIAIENVDGDTIKVNEDGCTKGFEYYLYAAEITLNAFGAYLQDG